MSSAVEFRVSVPKYLLVRGASTVLSPGISAGPLGALRLVERERPQLPADDWLGIDVLSSGICGTDLACISFRGPTALEPFASFPAILGHEILGRVSELGPAVEGFSLGDRVVVDPVIDCSTRGVSESDWCGACQRGIKAACEHAGNAGPLAIAGAPLARGNFVGFHAQLAGGWGSALVAPQAKVFRVPATLSDRLAVLVEPLAVAVHGVLGSWDALGESVLVLGAGPIGLGTAWALRALGYTGHVVVQAKRESEADLARRLGADRSVRPGAEARAELLALGATAHQPRIGAEVYMGGFDSVFDCVGSSTSFQQALRSVRAGGQVGMLGCCTMFSQVDQTFLWARQLVVRGFTAYGPETWQGETLHTFEVTLRLLEQTGAPIDAMITHEFALSDYKKALSALFNRDQSGAIKVVLNPGSEA